MSLSSPPLRPKAKPGDRKQCPLHQMFQSYRYIELFWGKDVYTELLLRQIKIRVIFAIFS